jgi:hypothetical protein
MTPTREKLLRLALDMPEEPVGVTARSIVWICPGLANESRPIFQKSKAELLEALGTIIHDPVLRERFSAELDKLKTEHVPAEPIGGNVVALFGGA